MSSRGLCVIAVLVAASLTGGALSAPEQVDYTRQIKPLLKARCGACHGALKQESGLRLDTAALALKGGAGGRVIQPGNAAASPLLQRVTAAVNEGRMPPEGDPLKPAEIALLRDWIQEGAKSPAGEQAEPDPRSHWSFRPVRKPTPPQLRNAAWVRNPIDSFLAQGYAQHGLKPQPEAPRLELIRRLYLDLIGLPPTPEELARLEADRSAGWYERLVDRLLDDPRHGERWARHWMDIWRYSDWSGLGDQRRNSQDHIWHWRDWLVESLNADTSYDEMVREMLAADELYPNDLQRLRATGFLARNYFLFNRNQWLEETVEHVSKGFLGLTVNCAKCHDHKYDPIKQADFYRLRAFFEPYQVRQDVLPGEPDLTRDGIPRAFDGQLETPTYLFIRGQESQPDKTTPLTPGVPALLAFAPLQVQPVQLPAEAWQPERRPWVIAAHLEAARKRITAAEVARERSRASTGDPTGVRRAELALEVARADLSRVEQVAEAMRAGWARADAGGYDPALKKAEEERRIAAVRAERGLAAARARLTAAEAEERLRTAAAAQKAAREKELAAAQAAQGKAEEQAAAAVGPEERYTPLLGAQWSATRFLFSGTDDPAVPFLPRSSGRRTALARWITDRRNPLTARVAVNHLWSRHMGVPLVPTVFDFGRKGTPPTNPELLDWLAAEFVEHGWSMKHLHRLIVTSAAYRMSSSKRGAEASQAKDPDNHYFWRREPVRLESEVVRDSILSLAGTLDGTRGGPPVLAAAQAASRRRSLYFFHSETDRNLFLTTFDGAAVRECYRRDQSIVPQQALALTNSALVLDSAGPIAERLSKTATGERLDDPAFIRQAFAVMLGISASGAELSASQRALESWRGQGPAGSDRSHFIWALLNHNDFVTVR